MLKTPKNYSIGRENNYYFSYMYNCIYDCRYCFLQGLYSSSNLVIFVNYDDFLNEIKVLDNSKIAKKTTIFSGYDCDSMAYDSVTNFSESLIKNLMNLNRIRNKNKKHLYKTINEKKYKKSCNSI